MEEEAMPNAQNPGPDPQEVAQGNKTKCDDLERNLEVLVEGAGLLLKEAPAIKARVRALELASGLPQIYGDDRDKFEGLATRIERFISKGSFQG